MDEVQNEFVSLYQQLIDWSDNDPASIQRDCELDESLEQVCIKVFDAANEAARTLNKVDDTLPTARTSFIKALRDYENRFERSVRKVWFKATARHLVSLTGTTEMNIDGENVDAAAYLLRLTDSLGDHFEKFDRNPSEVIQSLGK